MTKCAVEDCPNETKYKPSSTYKLGIYCEKHRARIRRHGDPNTALKDHTPAVERWKKLYEVDPKTDCWMWTGVVDTRFGYGVISDGVANQHMAHRFVYQQVVGEIPADRELDHLCRRTSCVNPRHMGVVTHTVNVRRGDAGKSNWSKTQCKWGHEFTEQNTNLDKHGRRNCRACQRRLNREAQRRYRARKKAA